jgi:hypothetical protein
MFYRSALTKKIPALPIPFYAFFEACVNPQDLSPDVGDFIRKHLLVDQDISGLVDPEPADEWETVDPVLPPPPDSSKYDLDLYESTLIS